MIKNNYINIFLISGGGIIAGLLNYIYHPLMLQFLTLEEFGEFGTLVGIFNIFGVFVVGCILFLNKLNSQKLNQPQELKYIFQSSTLFFGFIGVSIYFLFLFFIPFISHFLNIPSYFLIAVTALSLILSFLTISTQATLRATKAFHIISILQILGPILKLLFGLLFVFVGYGIFGAIGGFIFSGLFIFLVGYLFVNKIFYGVEKKGNLSELITIFNDSKTEISQFFVVSFLFAVWMNVDILLVKNIFTDYSAGIYAGLSVLGKFLIYLLLSVETVYYGQIMEHSNKNTPTHLLRNPLILMLFLIFGALSLNFIFGEYFLNFLKSDLVDYKNIYLLNLAFYGEIAFISFFSKVLIGWKKYYTNFIGAIGAFFLVFGVYFFGSRSLLDFSYVLLFVGTFTTIMYSIVFFIEFHRISK